MLLDVLKNWNNQGITTLQSMWSIIKSEDFFFFLKKFYVRFQLLLKNKIKVIFINALRSRMALLTHWPFPLPHQWRHLCRWSSICSRYNSCPIETNIISSICRRLLLGMPNRHPLHHSKSTSTHTSQRTLSCPPHHQPSHNLAQKGFPLAIIPPLRPSTALHSMGTKQS